MRPRRSSLLQINLRALCFPLLGGPFVLANIDLGTHSMGKEGLLDITFSSFSLTAG